MNTKKLLLPLLLVGGGAAAYFYFRSKKSNRGANISDDTPDVVLDATKPGTKISNTIATAKSLMSELPDAIAQIKTLTGSIKIRKGKKKKGVKAKKVKTGKYQKGTNYIKLPSPPKTSYNPAQFQFY